jgi:hypothetical protein
VPDENGDMLTDSQNILNRRKNYFSQLLNIHRVSDVREIEIHTVEPLVSDPRPSEFKIALAMSKKFKLPGSVPILAELIQAGGETIWSRSIHSLILFGIRKNGLICGRILILHQFTRGAIKLTVAIIMR